MDVDLTGEVYIMEEDSSLMGQRLVYTIWNTENGLHLQICIILSSLLQVCPG